MKDILEKLISVRAGLNAAQKDLDSIEIPSKRDAILIRNQIQEVENLFSTATYSLIAKQKLFLQVLLMVARNSYHNPGHHSNISVGKHALFHSGHGWTLKSKEKYLDLFGLGEASNVFVEVCSILIEEIAAIPESIKSDELQEKLQDLNRLLAESQVALAKFG